MQHLRSPWDLHLLKIKISEVAASCRPFLVMITGIILETVMKMFRNENKAQLSALAGGFEAYAALDGSALRSSRQPRGHVRQSLGRCGRTGAAAVCGARLIVTAAPRTHQRAPAWWSLPKAMTAQTEALRPDGSGVTGGGAIEAHAIAQGCPPSQPHSLDRASRMPASDGGTEHRRRSSQVIADCLGV